MKIRLETIPVWDELKNDGECFLCTLKEKGERQAVRYYLGPSVMNPETRVEVNRRGFCRHHLDQLLEGDNSQGLSLMEDTYLQAVRDDLKKSMTAILNQKSERRMAKTTDAFFEAFEKRAADCLVCDQIKQYETRYLYTTAYLWADDPDFREALKASKGFCLPHYRALLEMGRKALKKNQFFDFAKEITALELENLERMQKQIWWMTQKYKGENFDKPWDGCEDAHRRTALKLSGS